MRPQLLLLTDTSLFLHAKEGRAHLDAYSISKPKKEDSLVTSIRI